MLTASQVRWTVHKDKGSNGQDLSEDAYPQPPSSILLQKGDTLYESRFTKLYSLIIIIDNYIMPKVKWGFGKKKM